MTQPAERLSKGDVEKLMAAEMMGGLQFVYGADNIAADRDRNYDYYRGVMNDLPAANGRSQVVEPTVANYINLLTPSLLRIFTSGRTIAEYVSPKPELHKPVKLITRFVNDVVFRKDNRGELILNDWAFDGLVQKLGIVMWWWEEKYETKDEVLQNVPEPMLEQAVGDGEVIEGEQTGAQPIPTPTGVIEVPLFSVKVRRKVNKSQCCIDTIVPEEFVMSRDARVLDQAVLRGYTTGVMAGDLIAQGYNENEIDELPEWTDTFYAGTMKYNATNYTTNPSRALSVDPALKKKRVTYGILRCNYDGTGLKEWYVVAGGDPQALKLLEIQPYNHQIGFADFCPEPMPHTVYGRCPADRLAGIQKINTVLIRQANDNIFLSNTPQREVVMDWIIKPDQLMNMAPGAPVLVKQPGAIREIAVPFVADKVFGMLDYYNGQAEITTGVSRNSAGLDPEVLQNQSATAANNMMTAQQGRAEMIARIWAQGGLRKLFRGIFLCIKAYQDFERIEQIDGEPQKINPALWEGLDDLDVNINTGLGSGNRERDFALLTSIAAEQKEILAQFGPNNPIVDLKKAVRTLQLKAEAAGINYPENFFGDPVNPDGSDWQFKPPPPQPTPDTVVNAQALVQIEQIKAQSAEVRDVAKNQLEREKTVAQIASDERVAYRQQDIDAAVKTGQLQVEHAKVVVAAAKVDAENIRTDMERADKD